MRIRAARVVVALISTILLVLAIAAPAAARQVAPGPIAQSNHFGAIAIEPQTHAFGWGAGYSTKAGAIDRSVQACRNHATNPNHCVAYIWVRNGCAAVAYKNKASGGYQYGWGVGYTKAVAKQQARAAVGAGAHDLVWVCSG